MTTLQEFCYICFECSKYLKDLLKSEEECLELIAKLRVCVSEVNWSSNKKLLLCDKCIKKLNKAHEFKKQCIQSSETLKLYLSELQKTKETKVEKKEEPLVLQYLNLIKDDKSIKKPPIFTKLPETQVYPAITKIILTNQPSTFQNVFLNVLPQNAANNNKTGKVGTTKNSFSINIPPLIQVKPQKDANKNKREKDKNLSKLLVDTSMEEVSVEVDPLDFSMEEKNDPKVIQVTNNKFRPILPKLPENKKSENYDYTNEEKMEFFGSGHFLLQDLEKSSRSFCDKCNIRFQTLTMLHTHIKLVHNSEYPYKCTICGLEFAAKDFYKAHMSRHTESSDLLKNSVTLTDFANNSPKINDLLPQSQSTSEPEEKPEEEVKCDECGRIFTSNQGLVRHKAKLHNQNNSYKRKKYFVKGMKNAQCDICNRMFSTQSYMNLHRKLHDRKGMWRRKIYKQEDLSESQNSEDVSSDVDMEDVEEILEKTRVRTVQLTPTKEKKIIKIKKVTLKPSDKKLTSKCLYCDEVFGGEGDLQRHLDKIHVKTTWYKCQYCGGSFREGFILTKHLLTHCEVLCGECDEKFSSTYQLNDHISKLHDDNAPGICGICDENFDEMDELKHHVNNHLKVYKCYLCCEKFEKCIDLTKHLVEHCGSLEHSTCAIKNEASEKK